MALKFFIFATAILTIGSFFGVQGHGRVTDPPHRGWAWREGFGTPEEWTDNENFCGGFGVQYGQNNGKCGTCGDDFKIPQPRPNENGGKLGVGKIVRTYKAGSEMEVNVQLTASHEGYFEFALCPLKNPTDVETEECFDAHKLELASGGTRFTKIVSGPKDYKIKLVLPKNFTCEHCSFRWHYRTGNGWGPCENGGYGRGCGNQEIFRSCSDITIV